MNDETIKLKSGANVSKQNYIDAKTRGLREFGYDTLAEGEVSEQLNQVLSGGNLSVIGHFIMSDLAENQE